MPTKTRTRKTLPQPSAIESKKPLGLISVGALIAAAGAGLYLATQTDLLQRRRVSPGRTLLDALTRPPALIGLGTAVGLGLFRWQFARLFSEQAPYDVETLLGHGDVEIRHYGPQTVAETSIRVETFRDALDAGFRVLAEYIFGHNATGERIEMTAPVTQIRERKTDLAMQEDGSWLVRFVMPNTYSLASLPSPLNHEVRLRALPARRVAALRYKGTFNGDDTEQMQLRLLANLKARGLKPAGTAGFAGYDAPSTLPFLRRNEAWVELA